MSQVIYRKYRPQSFSEVKGQEGVVPILIESVLQDKISHAYLFSGPRGCGKTTMARLMTKAINCINFKNKNDICNECIYCESINSGNNVDIVEMDAASNRGIEEIRSLKDTVNFMPNFLKKKIYIIDEAHMLTKEAFNALLKTLEEPPEHVVFILATTEAHKLPITILSRVLRFDFKFGSEDEVLEKLKFIVDKEGIKIENEGLRVIYKYSGGSFRDAESILGKILISFNSKEITLDKVYASLGIIADNDIEALVRAITGKDENGMIAILDKLLGSDSNANIIIDQMLDYLQRTIIGNLKAGSDANLFIKLAGLLIKAKNELRDFNDKNLILKIELIKIIAELRGGEMRLIASVPMESAKDIKPHIAESSKEIETQDASSVQPSIIGDLTIETFISRFKAEASKLSPRLVGIISNSRLSLNADSLIIANKHKFNNTFLSKKDVRDLITKIGEEVFNKRLSLNYVVDDSIEELKGQDNILSLQPEIKKDDKIENIEETRLIASVPSEPQKDNSNLVENLL